MNTASTSEVCETICLIQILNPREASFYQKTKSQYLATYRNLFQNIVVQHNLSSITKLYLVRTGTTRIIFVSTTGLRVISVIRLAI